MKYQENTEIGVTCTDVMIFGTIVLYSNDKELPFMCLPGDQTN